MQRRGANLNPGLLQYNRFFHFPAHNVHFRLNNLSFFINYLRMSLSNQQMEVIFKKNNSRPQREGLDYSKIQQIKSIKYSERNNSKTDEKESCVICLEDFEHHHYIKNLVCKHFVT